MAYTSKVFYQKYNVAQPSQFVWLDTLSLYNDIKGRNYLKIGYLIFNKTLQIQSVLSIYQPQPTISLAIASFQTVLDPLTNDSRYGFCVIYLIGMKIGQSIMNTRLKLMYLFELKGFYCFLYRCNHVKTLRAMGHRNLQNYIQIIKIFSGISPLKFGLTINEFSDFTL